MRETSVEQIALKAQENELTEYYIYNRLADTCKNENNAAVLRKIGADELRHAKFWQTKTNKEIPPKRSKIFWTVLKAKILGITFALKQMEKNEGTGSAFYNDVAKYYPETKGLSAEEAAHEKKILNMLDEEKLQYVGSIVLGLNDALVELTGALAGFTLTLGDARIISMAGLVTGISAAFSMAASDYLSSKADNDPRAKKSAVYTGVAYLFTVICLILPFLLIGNKFIALGITIAVVILIIYAFNFYISVAKDLDFKSRFWEMITISLGVAAFSFFVGYLLNMFLGV